MAASPCELSVATIEAVAIVKIRGHANFTSSVPFRHLVELLLKRHTRELVLDLGDCALMDSTFLGVLAGLGLKGAHPNQDEASLSIILLNPNQRIVELLETLGIDHLFEFVHRSTAPSQEFQSVEMEPAKDARELSETCLKAHQILMSLNPANVPKFKEVTRFFKEELKKGRS